MKTTWRVFQMLTASVGEYDLKTQVTPHGIFRECLYLPANSGAFETVDSAIVEAVRV